MRRWAVVLFVVCIVAVFSVSMLAWGLSNGIFAQLSGRGFGDFDEERVLTAAESVDYVAITNKSRFATSTYDEIYGYPQTFANFVDKEVLDYYQTRYNYQQKQTSPKNVSIDYVTNVIKLDNVHILTETQASHIPNIPYTAISFYDLDSSTHLAIDPMPANTYTDVFCKEQSGYKVLTGYTVLQSACDSTFSNCYVVEMKFDYHENNGRLLPGFSSRVHQIVVLDQNLVPVWIGISVGHFVS